MLKLTFYVPESHLEAVKTALFEAGAGRLGDYERCAWQVKGQGQFRPLPGSDPYLGKQGELEVVDEYRVEMICPDGCVNEVIAALKASHPYETAAYDLIRLEEL
jgi:hypothetical protein